MVSRQHDQRDGPGAVNAFSKGSNGAHGVAEAVGPYPARGRKSSEEIFIREVPSGIPELDVIPENDTVLDAAPLSQDDWPMNLEGKLTELIGKTNAGENARVGEELLRIRFEKKSDLDRAAQLIVRKAIDEPAYMEACAVLACNLHQKVPRLPAASPGKKAESFLYALLDACQTEFEVLLDTLQQESEKGPRGARMLATVRFAGLLHCQGLLGMRVVGQMVHDLMNNNALDCARELCWQVGADLPDQTRYEGLVHNG